MLWAFRVDSFVPHQRYQGELPGFKNTIQIDGADIPPDWQKVFLNLSSHYPPTPPPTERILEILDNSGESKRAGRLQHYRHHMDTSLKIITH